jgi:hypothetical protein
LGRYPQLPQRAAEPPSPLEQKQPIVAPQPSSTQRLRDEIASLNIDIAERNRAAGAPTEGVEAPAEEQGVDVDEGMTAGGGPGGAVVGGESGVESLEEEEELPSAPTHRIPVRAAEDDRPASCQDRVAAPYAG